MRPTYSRNCGLSLVEILVCISIIVLLFALLMPSLATATEASRGAQCMSRLRQIGVGQEYYSQDFNGYYSLAYYMNTVTGSEMLWPHTGKPQNYLQISPTDRSFSGPFMCPTYTSSSSPRSTWDYNSLPLNTSYTVNRSVGQYSNDPSSPTSYSSINGTPWMRRPTNARLITVPASKAMLIDGIYRDSMRVNYTTDPEGLMRSANLLMNRHLNQTNNLLFFDNHVQRAGADELNSRALEWWSLPLVSGPPF